MGVGGVVIVVEVVVLVLVVPVLIIDQRVILCFVNEHIDIPAKKVKKFMKWRVSKVLFYKNNINKSLSSTLLYIYLKQIKNNFQEHKTNFWH
mgnify:CR=1 FL=1